MLDAYPADVMNCPPTADEAFPELSAAGGGGGGGCEDGGEASRAFSRVSLICSDGAPMSFVVDTSAPDPAAAAAATAAS